MAQPDFLQAARFLQILDPSAEYRSLLDGTSDGFSFRTFDDIKTRKDRDLAMTRHGTFDQLSAALWEKNKKRAGVFVTINETDMQGATLKNIVRARAIWVEDDEGLGIQLPVEPHIITETSPGKFHKIILVSGISNEEHQRLQQVLVDHFGSDPNAKDLARVLRVPGFYHCKGAPFLVKLIHESGAEPYTAEQLSEIFPTEKFPVLVKQAVLPPPAAQETIEGDYIPLSEEDTKYAPLPDITLDNAEQYLPEPGNQSYAQWRDIGMILHHQFQGSYEALLMFDKWSQNVREYQGFEDVSKSWASFGKRTSGPEVTFRTLIKEHKALQVEVKKTRDAEAIEQAGALLESCTDHLVLIRDVAPRLWRLANENVSLEQDFLEGLRTRYAALREGHVLSVANARRAMRVRQDTRDHTEVPDAPEFVNGNAPDWARNWVWVSSEEIFFNVITGVKLTTRGFNGYFDSRLPRGEGSPTSSADFVRDSYFVQKVMAKKYMPACDMFFVDRGVTCVNTYTDRFRCPIPEAIETPAGEKAANILRRHIELVCGGWNREAQLLCNFLASCVGRPPIKIRWALLLLGDEGDGKSLFFKLLMRALGPSNTKAIKGSTIANSAKTSFSGWVEGHCLGFIEEIKWHGHNRHEITNSIKDVLTNDVIECHEKGKETRTVANTANYILTTNFEDAIPLGDKDRRYFVLKSSFPLKRIHLEEPDYFDILHEAIVSDQCGDMLRWVLDIPKHPDFNPNGHAPTTDAKKNIIKVCKDELAEVVSEIIEDDKNPLFMGDVVSFTPLWDRIVAQSNRTLEAKNTYRLTSALLSLGYVKLDRVRIQGDRHCLWAKRSADTVMSLEEAKQTVLNRLGEYDAREGLI
jgi:hypothetical protein